MTNSSSKTGSSLLSWIFDDPESVLIDIGTVRLLSPLAPCCLRNVGRYFGVLAVVVCAGLLASCVDNASYVRDSSLPLDDFTSADVLRAAEGRLPQFFECLHNVNVPIISAHRGAPSDQLPENAIATFEETASKGAIIMEVDLLPSADGVLFLHHDETLERSTTGNGPIGDAPELVLRQLKLRDKAGRPTTQSMSTLEELLEWSRDRTLLQLDVKPPTSVSAVVEAVQKAGASGRVIYIMYSLDDAMTLNQMQSDAIISIGVDQYSDIEQAIDRGLDAHRIHALVNDLKPDPVFYSMLAKSGASVVFGTYRGAKPIDDMDTKSRSEIYRHISSSGVALIVTNRPGLLQEVLYERGDYRVGLRTCGVGSAASKFAGIATSIVSTISSQGSSTDARPSGSAADQISASSAGCVK